MSDPCTASYCGLLLMDLRDAMQELKLFCYLKYKYKFKLHCISIFRCLFPCLPGWCIFSGSQKLKRSFLPHVTPQYSSTESHLEQMEKTIATAHRLNFLKQGHIFCFRIVRNTRYNSLGCKKAHQHSTNLQSWSSIPRQQGE